MPPISAAADVRGIAIVLPALPYQPFPLEGFDFVGPLTFAGLHARLFLFGPLRLVVLINERLGSKHFNFRQRAGLAKASIASDASIDGMSHW